MPSAASNTRNNSPASPTVRAALLDAYIFQTSRRDLMNLSFQESRLRRLREKDIPELTQIQQERKARHESPLTAAAHMYERFKRNGEPFHPAEFGFEFSFDESSAASASSKVIASIATILEQFALIRAKQLREEREERNRWS
jgi:hypothetical protein